MDTALFRILICVFASLGTAVIAAEGEVTSPGTRDLRGSEALLSCSPLRLIVGEVHGTAEIPLLVAELVDSLSVDNETFLCLEISSSEQQRLKAFLASDGSEDAVRALLSGVHWVGSDGRASRGMLNMLELVRQLASGGRRVRVAAIDGDSLNTLPFRTEPLTEQEALELSRERDKEMATNVERLVTLKPAANFVVLVGNVHARTQQGTTWDAEYRPLGWYLKQKPAGFISLNYQSSGGQAWVMDDKGVGRPRDFPGTNRGDTPFVELYKTTKNGFDGVLYVGRTTASPPARKKTSSAAELWEQLKRIAPFGSLSDEAAAK